MRNRDRTLSLRLDDAELAKAHALAEREDKPIGAMIRGWIDSHWKAAFGDAAPPASKTKFGDRITPTKGARR